jgi:hypothetical protein
MKHEQFKTSTIELSKETASAQKSASTQASQTASQTASARYIEEETARTATAERAR